MFDTYTQPKKSHYFYPFFVMLIGLAIGHNLPTTWDVVIATIVIFFISACLTVQTTVSIILYELSMYFDKTELQEFKPKLFVDGKEYQELEEE